MAKCDGLDPDRLAGPKQHHGCHAIVLRTSAAGRTLRSSTRCTGSLDKAFGCGPGRSRKGDALLIAETRMSKRDDVEGRIRLAIGPKQQAGRLANRHA